jgi:release factor glutamine methyltransferase
LHAAGVSGHAARARSAREAISAAPSTLAAAGCETPRLDAELLLAHALGCSREHLLVENAELDTHAARCFGDLLERRAHMREPVAYITGRRWFRTLELAVDPRALIPRPETELLVEVGLSLQRGAAVLDVGTGCGAVALALASERPDLHVSASDVDPDALALARGNAGALGIELTLHRSDLLADVRDEFAAVLANLPYVAERERGLLAPEIAHEPPRALFAGEDGLAVIRRLIAQAARRPRISLLALEVGAGHAGPVATLLREHGFEHARCERDLAGIERVVVGERPAL